MADEAEEDTQEQGTSKGDQDKDYDPLDDIIDESLKRSKRLEKVSIQAGFETYQNKVFHQAGSISICLSFQNLKSPPRQTLAAKRTRRNLAAVSYAQDDDDDEPVVKRKFSSSGFKRKFFPRFQAGSNLIFGRSL